MGSTQLAPKRLELYIDGDATHKFDMRVVKCNSEVGGGCGGKREVEARKARLEHSAKKNAAGSTSTSSSSSPYDKTLNSKQGGDYTFADRESSSWLDWLVGFSDADDERKTEMKHPVTEWSGHHNVYGRAGLTKPEFVGQELQQIPLVSRGGGGGGTGSGRVGESPHSKSYMVKAHHADRLQPPVWGFSDGFVGGARE